jgi:acetyl-CoA carboxylase biotin carboxyl carrier protein
MSAPAHQEAPAHHAPQTPVTAVTAPPAIVKTEVEQPSGLVEIKSPMVGTFYRSASPDKPYYVQIGDEIKPGSPLCIIEAMKLFNEIESEISGKIVKILVDDSKPVEYDQPLFLVDPS